MLKTNKTLGILLPALALVLAIKLLVILGVVSAALIFLVFMIVACTYEMLKRTKLIFWHKISNNMLIVHK